MNASYRRAGGPNCIKPLGTHQATHKLSRAATRLAQGGGIVDLSHLRTPPGTLALILFANGIRVATTKLIVVR